MALLLLLLLLLTMMTIQSHTHALIIDTHTFASGRFHQRFMARFQAAFQSSAILSICAHLILIDIAMHAASCHSSSLSSMCYADVIEVTSLAMEQTSQAQYHQRLATSHHSPFCTNDHINHLHINHIITDISQIM